MSKNINDKLAPKFFVKSRDLLSICHGLTMGPNSYKSIFGKLLESVFRKGYFTLQTIVVLADMVEKDKGNQVVFAGSILDLSRRVFEDMIYMEYINARGKEKYSKQFYDYVAIEQKDDLDFSLKLKSKKDKVLITAVENDYAEAPKKLKDGRHNWLGLSVEQAIDWLVKKGKIKELDKENIVRLYLIGNRKNHNSPTDIINYNSQELLENTAGIEIEMGMMITQGALARIGLFLIEEVSTDDKTKKELWEYWKNIGQDAV